MRYIDISKIRLPEGWEEKARKALEEVKALPPEERPKAINDRGQIWFEVKNALAELSHDKCWYCEAIQVRSDKAVDHFRPKNRIAESAEHDGYWWLAFDWHNYRYSCTFCNSRRIDEDTGSVGGKQDHFPIKDELQRAKNETDDLTIERPCLLDPTVSLDPSLLWYGQDGMPVTRRNDPWSCERVKVSVELYNLKHSDLVERRIILIRDIISAIKIGNKLNERYEAGDDEAEMMLNEVTATLRSKMRKEFEFSSTVCCTLMGYRNLPWVEDLFTSN